MTNDKPANDPDDRDFTVALPRYKCHKIVAAAKIVAIDHGARLDIAPHGLFEAGAAWIREKKAEVGGYLVQYDDGYFSYSPAKAFEDGYTAVAANDPLPMGEMTIQGAIGKALWFRQQPEVVIDTATALRTIDTLLSALEFSQCYFKALQKGEEVFVLRQPDRAAPAAIREWVRLADSHGCGPAKVVDAMATAGRWSAQDPSTTKWPD